MKVKELINQLLDAPIDAEVMVGNEEAIEGSTDSDIELVKIVRAPSAKGGAYVSIEVASWSCSTSPTSNSSESTNSSGRSCDGR